MKSLFIAILTLLITFNVSANEQENSLNEIKNYRQITTNFASAGMPTPVEFEAIKKMGYQHIINLIPGNFSNEQQNVTSLGMSFEQIPVAWGEPTLADFQQFVTLMNNYQQDKVLVHCRLNYRASAFSYLYQITQQGANKETAKKQMLSVWQPEGTWLKFINKVEQHYKK